jgi:cysteinyl-tRNA synthetase
MKLFNSLTGRKETFVPADPKRPTMYVCGPTVYNYAHIGNARAAVVFDVLYRVLKHRYGDVLYVRNITDIDDKIIKAAAERGVSTEAIAAEFTRAYHEDMDALKVERSGELSTERIIEPFATQHIPDMLAMIAALIETGHAYVAEGHVLFHVPSFADYGRLSRRSREEMIDGARVEVAPYKRDPADFVLWKPSGAEQPGWESPYGRGRPGWHIECSAMVEAHLGVTIDIHGGGQDLKFPHHENEIAQSVCAHHGAPLARFWLHNGFLDIEREKMSKSLGNVLLVRNLLPEADSSARQKQGEIIRYALLSTHYRRPLDWSDGTLDQARRALEALYTAIRDGSDLPRAEDISREVPVPQRILAALEDDLNTPRAFAELRALARAANASSDASERRDLKQQLLAGGGLLGLLGHQNWFQQAITGYLAATEAPDTFTAIAPVGIVAAEVEHLIELRSAARRARNFAEADRIRDRLAAAGVILEDGPAGTRWRRAG